MHRAEDIHTLHQQRESLEVQFSLLQRTKTKELALDRINIVGFTEQKNKTVRASGHAENSMVAVPRREAKKAGLANLQ